MPLRTFRSHPSPLHRLHGTTLVLIACLAALLVTAALLATFAWRDHVTLRERAGGVATTVSMLVAEHAARLVETSDVILKQVVDLAGPAGAPLPGDRAAWQRLLDLAAATPYVTGVWLGDAAGDVVLTSAQYPAPDMNVADRPYFQALKRGYTGLLISHLESGHLSGKPLIALSRPLAAPANGFRGYAAVTVSPRYFRELYRSLDLGFPMRVTLRRQDGTVLVDEAADGVAEPDGITARSAVEGLGLVAEVTVPRSAVRALWLGRAGIYAAYGALALVVVVGIGTLAIQRARREREAEDALQHAYDTLEERVHQRTAELQDANERLEGALADKEVLLREVQHRVKNNLTVMCSLLRLQASRLDERARFPVQESLRRIQSMSLVHELLYHSNEPARIDFADYLRRLCDSLTRAAGPTPTRVVVEARPWQVDVDRAMPLALIVSELVSNALRHAHPDGRAGTVRVDLEPGEDGVRLAVSDDGVGLPADLPAPAPAHARRRGGLGLVLVQALAAQAHAELRIDREGGTTFALTLPTAVRQPQAA